MHKRITGRPLTDRYTLVLSSTPVRQQNEVGTHTHQSASSSNQYKYDQLDFRPLVHNLGYSNSGFKNDSFGKSPASGRDIMRQEN